MLHAVPLAGGLEGIGRETGAAVGEHVGALALKSPERVRQEGDGRGRGLVALDREVHAARGAVDGDVQGVFARDAFAILRKWRATKVSASRRTPAERRSAHTMAPSSSLARQGSL